MRVILRCGVLSLVLLVGCTQAVTVSPETASIRPGGTVQFHAAIDGKATEAFRWAVDEAEGGAISESGLYTAPASSGTYHVRATSSSDSKSSATAEVTVVSQLEPEVEVKVAPSFAKLRHGETLQLEATVTGTTATGVTWTASAGSISEVGLFTAPQTAQVVTVTATSVVVPTKQATATITVTGVIGVTLSPASTSLLPGGTRVRNDRFMKFGS